MRHLEWDNSMRHFRYQSNLQHWDTILCLILGTLFRICTDVFKLSFAVIKYTKKAACLAFFMAICNILQHIFLECSSSSRSERGKTTNCTFIVVLCQGKKDWLGATCGQLLPVISSLPKNAAAKQVFFRFAFVVRNYESAIF